MILPLTDCIRMQLLVNKYSKFNTIFVNEKEYKVINITELEIELT